MLNNLEKTPLRPYWYLSVLFIALGVYGSLSGVLPLTWDLVHCWRGSSNCYSIQL